MLKNFIRIGIFVLLVVFIISLYAQGKGGKYESDEFSFVFDAQYTLNALLCEVEQITRDSLLSSIGRKLQDERYSFAGSVPLRDEKHVCSGDLPEDSDDGIIQLFSGHSKQGDGLYVVVRLTDNHWDDGNNDLSYTNDVVEIFLNKSSARKIYNKPQEYFPLPEKGQLTREFLRIRYHVGGAFHSDSINLCWFDTTVEIINDDLSNDDIMKCKTFSLTEAQDTFGIVVDFIPHGADTVQRMQELFIPWTIIGGPGNGISRKIEEGESFGFTYGYNDMDPGQQSSTLLRWRNRADPLTNGVDAWGDILLSMPVMDAIRNVPVFSQQKIARTHYRNILHNPEIMVFTAQGIPVNTINSRQLPAGVYVVKSRDGVSSFVIGRF